MHPDHVANHPELIQAWDSGLKHKETFLLVIILSSPGNKERRNVIRDTWANTHRKYRDKFLLYFILGHQELSHEVSTEIQEEKSRHKDIFFTASHRFISNSDIKSACSFNTIE